MIRLYFIVLLIILFDIYCLLDLRRTDVEWLPKWWWAVAIVLISPLGGVAYLVIEREQRRRARW